ncbi:hypothetical protein J7J62_08960 [bacterium]|nr:hypothetical protein [bacterium]
MNNNNWQKDNREVALRIFTEDLKKEWDELVKEAKNSLDSEEEDFITYRMALLIFALRRIPNFQPYLRKFRKEIKYYI